MARIRISTDLLAQLLQRNLQLPHGVQSIREMPEYQQFEIATPIDGIEEDQRVIPVYQRTLDGKAKLVRFDRT